MINYIQYYDRYDVLIAKDKSFEMGFCLKFLMGFSAIIVAFTSFGILFLLIGQMFAIISEASYYEKEKDPLKESHYLIIPSKNNKSNVIFL